MGRRPVVAAAEVKDLPPRLSGLSSDAAFLT
jgi:hypothetical protein